MPWSPKRFRGNPTPSRVIRDNGLRIHLLNVGEDSTNVIEAFDPLFVDETPDDAKLDEHDWDGRTVSWLMMPKEIVLGSVRGQRVKATVEMTQLPHPPTFQFDGPNARVEARNRYGIGSGNYGFYVYRNKRLISWADRLDGIIPYDQDFYAFRGRILIDESADELFNINVSRSVITLSDEAQRAQEDETSEYKGKSKKAWNYAKKQVSLRTKQDSMGGIQRPRRAGWGRGRDASVRHGRQQGRRGKRDWPDSSGRVAWVP